MKGITASGFDQPALGGTPLPPRSGLLATREWIDVRFGGTFAQDVAFMGFVLAKAATLDHRYVMEMDTFGLEEGEGCGHADVIISDVPVDYPEMQAIDLLVALCGESAHDHAGLLRPDGVLIYDSDLVHEPPRSDCTAFGIPFETLAVDVTGRRPRAVQVLTLGAVAGITGVVSVASLRRALADPSAGESGIADEKALVLGSSLAPTEWRRSGP